MVPMSFRGTLEINWNVAHQSACEIIGFRITYLFAEDTISMKAFNLFISNEIEGTVSTGTESFSELCNIFKMLQLNEK